ncbi:hypothetical protein GmHk_10G029144 [Glycine max]|nr:hypothetical protein GmHk_10G029144 [Glycine max]
MAKVLSEFREVVEVDEYVEETKRMDVARILMRTQMEPLFQATVPATIDGAKYDLHVTEDASGLGATKKQNRNDLWFPPSPFSTQPNTPVTEGDGFPGATFCDECSDDVPDDPAGGSCDHRFMVPSSNARRDHWVQSLGRSVTDRSALTRVDVAQSQGDRVQSKHCPHVENELDKFNGHISRNGLALKASAEKALQGKIFKEKTPSTDCHAVEGQWVNTHGEISGQTSKDIQGEFEKAFPLAESLPHNTILNTMYPSMAYADSGQPNLKVLSEEMGQQICGPTPSATKVYVRRKEVLRTSKGHPQSSLYEDPIELQCALLKEMGLTYEEEDNKVKGGLGRGIKWTAVRRLIVKHKVDLVCLQETKRENFNKSICQAIWGDSTGHWDYVPSVQAAGGLLCMWNNSTFEVGRKEKGRSFLMLEGRCCSNNQKLTIVNVYAPCDLVGKKALWDELRQLKASNPSGMWCFLAIYQRLYAVVG